MRIIVIADALSMEDTINTGGEFAITTHEIHVDPQLPPRIQRNRVIHSVIEGFCANWCHDKVDELTDLIQDGLDQLDKEV